MPRDAALDGSLDYDRTPPSARPVLAAAEQVKNEYGQGRHESEGDADLEPEMAIVF